MDKRSLPSCTSEVLLPPLLDQETKHFCEVEQILADVETDYESDRDSLADFFEGPRYDFSFRETGPFKDGNNDVYGDFSCFSPRESISSPFPSEGNQEVRKNSRSSRCKNILRKLRNLSTSKGSQSSTENKSSQGGISRPGSVDNQRPPSLSTGSSICRQDSKPSVEISPLTPSLNSAVVTFGDPNFSAKSTISASENSLIFPQRNRSRTASVNEAKGVQDIISYLQCLNQEKATIIEAYDTTKERLLNCGWCSEEEVSALQSQKEASLYNIDAKLSEVECALNNKNGSIFEVSTFCQDNIVSPKDPLPRRRRCKLFEDPQELLGVSMEQDYFAC